MNRDQVLGVVAFALASGYYLIAATIPPSLLADAVGPQGLPRTYGLLLAGLSLILCIRSLPHTVRLKPDTASGRIGRRVRLPWPERTRRQPDPASRLERQKLLRVVGLLGIGAAYVVVVPWLGYMLSLAALIAATIRYQRGALSREVVLVALSGSIVFWLLFVLLLGIPQPPGFWPSLL